MPSKLWQLDPRLDPGLLAERDRRYVADSSPDVGGLHQERHPADRLYDPRLALQRLSSDPLQRTPRLAQRTGQTQRCSLTASGRGMSSHGLEPPRDASLEAEELDGD
jgi:hypothetical protein